MVSMLASSAVDRGFEPRLGQTTDYKIVIYCFSAKHAALRRQKKRLFGSESEYIPVNPPPLCGSLPCKSLISRMNWVSCTGDINLPHDLPPTKKSSTIKSWPTFCDQHFWKFPIWNSRAQGKRREIRMVKVFKWYPVIDLFDTFTGKLGHGD